MSWPRSKCRQIQPCEAIQCCSSLACEASSSRNAIRGAPAAGFALRSGIIPSSLPSRVFYRGAMDARTRILHVEDDRSLQNLVRVALEQLGGYAVCTAGTGTEAVQRAAEFAPQLLLLDLDLPDISGLATLRALRALPGLAGVPVVFLTAACSPEKQAELLAAGVDEILRKPFRPRALVQAVARVLEKPAAP